MLFRGGTERHAQGDRGADLVDVQRFGGHTGAGSRFQLVLTIGNVAECEITARVAVNRLHDLPERGSQLDLGVRHRAVIDGDYRADDSAAGVGLIQHLCFGYAA